MRITRRAQLAIRSLLAAAVFAVLLPLIFGVFNAVRTDGDGWESGEVVPLPTPNETGDVSVEKAITNRRSRREYGEDALTRDELGQLLWAAQGVTEQTSGLRAAPSAGALHPLELYAIVGTPGVKDIETGVYHYRPEKHEIVCGDSGNVQSELRAAALDQEDIEEAPVDIVVCAVDERTTPKYGERGRKRYVPMEAGHVGENLYLQAEALGLATVSIGAFEDERVQDIVGIPTTQRPLYIFPVGRSRR
ncbi:MAG: SagB/ThcOx family dehydrogenase [Haloarculaceae archaeon]